MSAVDSRPAPTRGRGSTRGGRGGFGRGGPRGGRRPVNGTSNDAAAVEESFEDQGELGEMKKKYSNELTMLKELFPHWTDTDLVFALEEADGDISSTVDKITQGNVSQFAEVKKNKDRARSKVKEEAAPTGSAHKSSADARAGRARGSLESTRGGRTRGSERGRGGVRGGRAGHATTNGAAKDVTTTSVPTTESTAWDATGITEATNGTSDELSADKAKDVSAASEIATAPQAEPAKSATVPQTAKTWASMLKPKPAPVPVAAPVKPRVQPPDPTSQQPSTTLPPTHTEPEQQPTPAAAPAPEVPIETAALEDVAEAAIPPSKVPLTEENVEHLPDESHPPATQTVVSTTGSVDPRNLTPLPEQQSSAARPQMGGYATTAARLAVPGGRSASFQRRVLEQQEAVVMPGHNALDRAAVQFGSMGLGGETGLDVDEEREEPETRQPHQHSPPSQPRTSLPPAPRQAANAPEAVAGESVPTPKQAPGLPPASVQNQQQTQDPSLGQHAQGQQLNQSYDPYGRFAQQPGPQQDAASQQKPFDPFAQQGQQNQYDPYGSHNQHHPQQSQSGFGGLSSSQNDYSAYYTSEPSRNAYNAYYGNSYAPQDTRAPGQHDPTIGQQRSVSGFGSAPTESAYGSQQGPQQAQSRFGETPGSGNNTPNPLLGNQQTGAPNTQQSQQSLHQGQHQQPSGYGTNSATGFPYGHPNYTSPYQQAYQNQFGYTPQAGGYGGGYPNKQGGMYGAPHSYGMGSQSHYDQYSSSPANTSGFGQNSMRSTSGVGSVLGGGMDDFGRGSAQSGSHQQNNYDPFARSTSGFGSQGSYGQQQTSSATQEDSLKAYNDTKSGPSPALGQQPGRPGSAANNSAANTTQSGLPPPQSHQTGYGGAYSGFPQSGQYGGLGGLGHQQQGQGQQQNAYSGYGGGFNQTYGGYGASRGGWGQNYSSH